MDEYGWDELCVGYLVVLDGVEGVFGVEFFYYDGGDVCG